MPGLAEISSPRFAGVSEHGRIVLGTLSLPPTSYGTKNEYTTKKGGGVSDFYGELSDLLLYVKRYVILLS